MAWDDIAENVLGGVLSLAGALLFMGLWYESPPPIGLMPVVGLAITACLAGTVANAVVILRWFREAA